MDPCPFVRIVIGNLALTLPQKSPTPSLPFYCRFKLRGLPAQISDVSLAAAEGDTVESRIHGCFALKKAELEKLSEKSSKFSSLKVEIRRRSGGKGQSCSGREGTRSGKLLGCVVVQLDLKSILENNGNSRACVMQNGWVAIGGSGMKLHLNVRAEPDPRFVFRFDGEPECSPQVFQVNGNVTQPVFTCKFGFRNARLWKVEKMKKSSSDKGIRAEDKTIIFLTQNIALLGPSHQPAEMQNHFTLLHTVATAGLFSAVSFWYGFMFGRESARKELGQLIETLRQSSSNPYPTSSSPPEHS